MAAGTEWIAVDWGTSALRAWAMDGDGAMIAHASSADGMGALAPDEFEPALLRLIADWLPGERARPLPVLACGMVGARQGWAEAAYRPVPCPPLGTPFSIPPLTDARLRVAIIPGLRQSNPADVMRGEETQIAGVLHATPDFDGVICLPGTHCKWARVARGEVLAFQTFMTGELFALISKQSVLRHTLACDEWSDEAFEDAARTVLRDPSGFAAKLFTLRADSLLHDSDPGAARARLSGMLIGLELAAAAPFWRKHEVTIVGGAKIASAYASALGGQGMDSTAADAETVTLDGLRAACRLFRETTSI